MPSPSQVEMRCPTCGARQTWAETCRRCKCDLSLLRAAAGAYEQHRRRCLENLLGAMFEKALAHAKSCHSLKPDAESFRLMALAQLGCRNWAGAWESARVALESSHAPPT